MRRFSWFVLLASLISSQAHGAEPPPREKPRFREFMGLCGHTILFKPKLYAPVCRAVRDYHPFDWDTGDDTGYTTKFPSARNGVDWAKVYGDWKTAGYETDVCVMFDNLPAKDWKNPARDAKVYGQAFGRAFGPSSKTALVSAVEIGNEPGLYDDKTYRELFQNMAAGLREGDPKLVIGTCALTTDKSERYAKSVKCVEGLEPLYDFINIHTYAEVEGYPTWKRSYPEDPKIVYLKTVERMIAWRDRHAPGKEIRITEFGWDASTKKAPATGTFAKWMGSTETQQAQYLVRSFLLFSKLDITRAYIFFFDDKDEPQVHGSSGLTRNGQPKPAFHAVAHLAKTLGDYRFHRVVKENVSDIYIYEYINADNPNQRIWAVWSPTGTDKKGPTALDVEGMQLVSAEQMPLSASPPPVMHPKAHEGKITVEFGESPLFLRFDGKPAAR